MSGTTALSYLREICRRMDAGLPVTHSLRKAMLPLALPMALAAGCSAPQENPEDWTEPQPTPEVCNDGLDNDGDGLADCADSECADSDACTAVPEYAAPMPEPEFTPDYGAPFEPQ